MSIQRKITTFLEKDPEEATTLFLSRREVEQVHELMRLPRAIDINIKNAAGRFRTMARALEGLLSDD